MGLDMFLTRRLSKYSMTPAQLSKLKKDYPDIHAVEEDVYEWRKANEIHKWFCDTLAGGDSINCSKRCVSREQLGELASLIDDVLRDHTKAKKLLPTQEGFFFGAQASQRGREDAIDECKSAINKFTFPLIPRADDCDRTKDQLIVVLDHIKNRR